MLSRNFSLQRGGDMAWLREHYEFDAIAFSVDELVILNVNRGDKQMAAFAQTVAELTTHCFMPIAAGGGIRSLDDAKTLLEAGADKIVVNTPLFDDPELVRSLVRRYGSQCVIASIDYRRGESDEVFTANGSRATGQTVSEAIALAESLGAGELYVTSINRDGTGQSCDVEFVSAIPTKIPLIISGGAGNFEHLETALRKNGISAVSTANLFNFMSDNLTEARNHLRAEGIALGTWEALSTSHAS